MLASIKGLFGKKENRQNQTVSQSGNISVRTPDEIADLEKAIKIGPITFVFVHADWCGHCQTYKPIWQELEAAPGRQATMAMIHHDMVENSPTLKNAKIPGYPTVLKVYPSGQIEKYGDKTNGMPNIRDKDAMMKQITEAVMASPMGKSIRNSMNTPQGQPIAMQTLGKNNISRMVSLASRRNIGNTITPDSKEITIGATKAPQLPLPPMMGGSLYAMLTRSLLPAGPTSALLAASQLLPPKKNSGSSKRLTRKQRRSSGNKKSRRA